MIFKNVIQNLQDQRYVGVYYFESGESTCCAELTLHLFSVFLISLCDLQLLRTRLHNSQKEVKCSWSSAENSLMLFLLMATTAPKTVLLKAEEKCVFTWCVLFSYAHTYLLSKAMGAQRMDLQLSAARMVSMSWLRNLLLDPSFRLRISPVLAQ